MTTTTMAGSCGWRCRAVFVSAFVAAGAGAVTFLVVVMLLGVADAVVVVVVDGVGRDVVVGVNEPFLVKNGASWLTSTSEKTVSY